MKITKHIPNIITLAHLLSGCIAIVMIFSGHLHIGCILVFVSAILDFCDGFAARMLNASSEIGGQLDSFADMVTFGVVPGLILYQLLASSYQGEIHAMNYPVILFAPAFLIPVFSALRLSKFNLSKDQTDHFIGLPTPACAIFIASLPLVIFNSPFGWKSLILNKVFLYGIILLFSYLLVSKIKMINLKFMNLKWHDNKEKYALLIISISLILIFKFAAAAPIIITYIIISIINHNLSKYTNEIQS